MGDFIKRVTAVFVLAFETVQAIEFRQLATALGVKFGEFLAKTREMFWILFIQTPLQVWKALSTKARAIYGSIKGK